MIIKYATIDALASAESRLEMPPEVLIYRLYLASFDKCIKNGILSYLLTNKCNMSTNNRVMNAINLQELNVILNYC
jgi:hypothetical protein